MKKEFKKELINLLKETTTKSIELKNLLDSFIQEQQVKCLNDMSISFNVAQNYRNEIKYYAARTFLPIGIDEEKEFRVYVGKVDDFKDGINSKEVVLIARQKLTKLIQEYREEQLVEN